MAEAKTNYFKKIKLPFSIIRYHNIYGPRMGFEHVIPEFCKRIFDNESPFKIFGGDNTRAFCYIDDAVKATVAIMRNSSCNGEVIHVGNSKEEVAISDLAKLMLEIDNKNTELKIENAPDGSVKRRCPDTSKLKDKTGFEAQISLKEGVSKSMEWYLNEYKKQTN